MTAAIEWRNNGKYALRITSQSKSCVLFSPSTFTPLLVTDRYTNKFGIFEHTMVVRLLLSILCTTMGAGSLYVSALYVPRDTTFNGAASVRALAARDDGCGAADPRGVCKIFADNGACQWKLDANDWRCTVTSCQTVSCEPPLSISNRTTTLTLLSTLMIGMGTGRFCRPETR